MADLRPNPDPHVLHDPQARPETVAPEFAYRLQEEEAFETAREFGRVTFLVWFAIVVALAFFILARPTRRDPYRSIDPAASTAREVSR